MQSKKSIADELGLLYALFVRKSMLCAYKILDDGPTFSDTGFHQYVSSLLFKPSRVKGALCPLQHWGLQFWGSAI